MTDVQPMHVLDGLLVDQVREVHRELTAHAATRLFDVPERHHERVLEHLYAKAKREGWDTSILDTYRNTLLLARTQVTSSGLTTTSPTYGAGDQVAARFDFAGQAVNSGGGGWLGNIELVSETVSIGTYTAFIFRDTVTAAADNAAFSISDADAEKHAFDPITLGPVRSYTLGSVSGWDGNKLYVCNATSLYALLRTEATHGVFTAATDLKLTLSTAQLS